MQNLISKGVTESVQTGKTEEKSGNLKTLLKSQENGKNFWKNVSNLGNFIFLLEKLLSILIIS